MGGSGDFSIAAISGLTDLIDVSNMGLVARGGFPSKIEDTERYEFASELGFTAVCGRYSKISYIERYGLGSTFGVMARGGFALDPAGFRYFAFTDSI